MSQSEYVQTQSYTFAQPPNELVLKSGGKLGPITLAYETYGKLNRDKSNAILIFHALTGDAHAAGLHKDSGTLGWWDPMIGAGKAFDTDKYFVICINCIGGCKGSTGPSSINPATGKPYGMSFPVITIEDMVQSQKRLMDHLGIKKLLCASGGSMGGLMAMEWAVRFPGTLRSAILIATNYKHTAQQIALHEAARQAIMSDPNWNQGDYYGKAVPAQGMAISRMIGHITYMSERSMEEKFGRKLQGKEKVGYDFSHDFEVQNYLHYRGASFVQRFDANSYLYISKALDYFDLSEDTDLLTVFKGVQTKFLVITFTSDWLYPSYQSKDVVKAMKANDIDVSFIEINTTYGHDSFLVEIDGQSRLVKSFLENIK